MIVAWRRWAAFPSWACGKPDGQLYPMHPAHDPWVPGENRAVCRPEKKTGKGAHAPPDASCSCGFWATREPLAPQQIWRLRYQDKVVSDDEACELVGPTVLGLAGLWGRCVPYEHGWRAERAKVVALVTWTGWLPEGMLDQIAAWYGVPVLSVEHARREWVTVGQDA